MMRPSRRFRLAANNRSPVNWEVSQPTRTGMWVADEGPRPARRFTPTTRPLCFQGGVL
jgi:hypothetical protein